MNLNLLFEDNTKDKAKRYFHKRIQKEALHISMLAIRRKLTSKSVDKLAKMYDEYFKKYPDDTAKINSEMQLNKLRILCT